MDASSFGSTGQSARSRIFALLTRYLEFYQNCSDDAIQVTHEIDAFWDKDERVNFWVKGQGHSITQGPAVRRVLISSCCPKTCRQAKKIRK